MSLPLWKFQFGTNLSLLKKHMLWGKIRVEPGRVPKPAGGLWRHQRCRSLHSLDRGAGWTGHGKGKPSFHQPKTVGRAYHVCSTWRQISMISGFDFGCTKKKGTNPPKRNERYGIFAITKVNTCSSKWLQSSSLCKQAQPACLILFFQPSPAKIRGLQHADLSSSLLVCSGGAIGPPWAPRCGFQFGCRRQKKMSQCSK